MVASGVMMQQASLTQTRQSPARSAPAARLNGMPTTQPQMLKANKSFFGPSLPSQKLTMKATRQRQASVTRAAKDYTIEIEKPLGLKLDNSKSPGGGLKVVGVSGNAAKSGLKVGDTVIYTSSFFGDELWPADKLGFSRSAIGACPSPVCLVYVQGENKDVNVKRLAKRPIPPRFGRRLTPTQKEKATHICVDCGYIYCDNTPFEDLGDSYRCPQCSAFKKRFAPYDAVTGKVKGRLPDQVATVATVVGGLVGVGVLGYLGLTLSQVN
ncbi:g9675 [Coccomyxa viridis]|uniref:G9675 protein n=1 Tax=Coccomyxa viridis TaxID=1274662 RepID=A0ABP1G3F1_9CHLO